MAVSIWYSHQHWSSSFTKPYCDVSGVSVRHHHHFPSISFCGFAARRFPLRPRPDLSSAPMMEWPFCFARLTLSSVFLAFWFTKAPWHSGSYWWWFWYRRRQDQTADLRLLPKWPDQTIKPYALSPGLRLYAESERPLMRFLQLSVPFHMGTFTY